MKKVKAIELIGTQQEAIEKIKELSESNKDFQVWREETKAVIKAIFGINSNYYKQLDALSFCPDSYLMPIVGNRSRPKPSEEQKRKAYRKGLDCCDALMSGMIAEINAWDDDDDNAESTGYAIDTVQIICNHFHQAVRQIRNRYDNRPTIDVNDEYDVQDLLHAFLRLHFDDVRAEEWTPSYAGSASRMDFLLKKDKIVIEVKKTRKNLGAKEVGEQLMIDIERYIAHPDCETLICFVYDPEGRVTNPVGIENDLNRETDNLKVITIITPK